ncbi:MULTISPECIES: YcaO-like family protein [unclassified Nitrospina]|uniref:YcaO-like family protein n=1 Tax=unclassified Nitrospina TaxID=2638683 RepID=UPI003F9CD3DD
METIETVLKARRSSSRHTPTSIEDSLKRAHRLVSDRTGIIQKVEFEELVCGEPNVFFARSHPANLKPISGKEALNNGDAASTDPDRAIMKAVGESIERYCSAQYEEEDLVLAPCEELDIPAVDPSGFALFSQSQYASPGFPFTAPDTQTPLCWARGYSLTHETPTFVPAAFVYVPYYYRAPDEPPVQDSISTGLACGSSLAASVYKAICEVIERDAFMIVWQNRLPRPRIDLESVHDPFVHQLLQALDGIPVTCNAYLLTLDIAVPVIVVMLQSTEGQVPHTVMGLGTCLNPNKALVLALEEALLTYIGMSRYARNNPEFQPDPDYRNVDKPTLHALAHALRPELRTAMDFLMAWPDKIPIQNLTNHFQPDMSANVQFLVKQLKKSNLDTVVLDLTTSDIDEAGFKVARAVVPGMQPLDLNHARQHLGGRRLYEVPYRLGLVGRPRTEHEMNPYPHPFP